MDDQLGSCTRITSQLLFPDGDSSHASALHVAYFVCYQGLWFKSISTIVTGKENVLQIELHTVSKLLKLNILFLCLNIQ